MSDILSSLEPLIWKLLSEFVPALGADVVSTLIFGPRRKAGPDILKKASDLAIAGKKDEAIAALRPHLGGLGLDDEMIFLSDMCALLRGGLITSAQAIKLAGYLAGLSQENRTRFREAHAKEPNHTIRYGNLVQLALLPGDAERTAFLTASGLMDRSPIEQVIADINTRAAVNNPTLNARIAARQAHIQRPRNASFWTRLTRGWFDINPLR